MNRFRLAARWTLTAAFLTVLPVLAFSILARRGEVTRARAEHRRVLAELAVVDHELLASEGRVRRLTSSVGAVELEARSQLRLVRPNESLILLKHED
jgi:cell division protein FtsB